MISPRDIKQYKEQEKKYYEKADYAWLLDKIKREEDLIEHNQRMIQLSKAEIEVCKELIVTKGIGSE